MSEETNLLAPGYYDAVAVEKTDDQGVVAFARWELSKNDAKQVIAYFQLIGHPEVFPIPWRGSFASTMLGESGKSVAQRTVESLRYMGLKGDDLLAIENQELNQIVSLQVEHDEWEGKTRLKVAWVNKPGGGVIKVKPLPEEAKRKFAAMMRASLAKVPEVEGERYAPSRVPNEAAQAVAAVREGMPATPPNGAPASNQRSYQAPPPDPMEDDIPF